MVRFVHLDSAWSLILSVHSDHSEGIHLGWQQSFRLGCHTIYIIVDNLAGVETLHHNAVLIQLVLRLHPLRLPLFPAHRETLFLIVSHSGILQSQMRGA